MKAGALEFLTKPVNDEDLLDAIQQAIAPIGRGRRGEVLGCTISERL
jgi:FixJ family two-component response regulator